MNIEAIVERLREAGVRIVGPDGKELDEIDLARLLPFDLLYNSTSDIISDITLSQQQARKIMGKNFFGIGEALKYLGLHPSKQELDALDKIPFTRNVLETCKDSHALVAVFPLSILAIRSLVASKLFYSGNPWYKNQAFAQEPGIARWLLVRKTPVPGSMDKNRDEQQALITKNKEVPTAQAMVYAIIAHFLATGERLFETTSVCCSDVDSIHHQVYVGFNHKGLCIGGIWRNDRYTSIGLSSIQKPDNS